MTTRRKSHIAAVAIEPGRYYTPETLPPLSPRAQAMIAQLNEIAPIQEVTEKDSGHRIDADWLGRVLGAEVYR